MKLIRFIKIIHRLITLLFLIAIPFWGFSQSKSENECDTLTNPISNKDLGFHYHQLIIPTVLIAYGIIGTENDQIKLFNQEIKEEVNEHIDKKITIDDFMQFIPAASVYGLNLAGIKGRNTFRDRSAILAASYLMMTVSVTGLKYTVKVERPDGHGNNSFPSGHTATAFASAEFLWQEYKDVSIWYGISGYIIATGTGAFRIYNKRHWFTDVAMGAGIGILTTKAAYWIYPAIKKTMFKSGNTTGMLTPFYDGKHAGVGLFAHF